jgi:hypothetical protein
MKLAASLVQSQVASMKLSITDTDPTATPVVAPTFTITQLMSKSTDGTWTGFVSGIPASATA